MANPLQLNIQVNVDDASINAVAQKLANLQKISLANIDVSGLTEALNAITASLTAQGNAIEGGQDKLNAYLTALREIKAEQAKVSGLVGGSDVSGSVNLSGQQEVKDLISQFEKLKAVSGGAINVDIDTSSLTAYKAKLEQVSNSLGEMGSDSTLTATQVNALKDTQASFASELVRVNELLQQQSTAISGSGSASENGGNKSKQFADAVRDVNRALKEQQTDLIKGNATLGQSIARFKELEDKLRKTADIKKLTSAESLRLATSQKTLASAISSAEKDILAQEKALQSTTKAQEKATTAEERAIATAVKNAQSSDLLIVKLDRLNLELKQTETGFKKGSISGEDAQKVYDRLEKEVLQLGEAYELTTKDQLKLSTAQRSVVNANLRAGNGFRSLSGAMNEQKEEAEKLRLKLGNISNQSLVDLSRGLEDSKQFAFGLNQGMTAIGNNIPQVIESLARLKKEAGSGAGAFKALIGNLTGVGGFLIAVNLAVLALPLLIDLFDKLRDSTDDAKISVQDLAEALDSELKSKLEEVITLRKELATLEGASFDKEASSVEEIQKALVVEEERLRVIKESAKVRRELIEGSLQREASQKKLITALDKEAIRDKRKEYNKLLANIQREEDKQNEIVESLKEQQKELKKKIEAQLEANRVFDQAKQANTLQKVLKEFDVFFASVKSTDAAIKIKLDFPDTEEVEDEIDSYDVIINSFKIRALREDDKLKGQLLLNEALFWARVKELTKLGLSRVEAEKVANAEKSLANAQVESDKLNKEILTSDNWLQEQRLVGEKAFKDRKIALMKQGLTEEEAINRTRIENNRQVAQQLASNFATFTNAISALFNQQAQQLQAAGDDKAAKKAFETGKKLSIATAITQTALATISAYANMSKFSPIAAAAAAGLAAATGAAQIALIARTKYGDRGSGTNKQGLGDGGNTSEGFTRRTMSGSFVAQNTALTSASTQQAPTIVIESAVNQDVLAYNVREGEATIRRNNAVMVSD